MDLPRGMTLKDAERTRDVAWALVDLRLNRRRQHGIFGEGKYRPHFVFGDSDEHGFIYWGVAIWLYDDKIDPGESGRGFVTFIYRPNEPPPPRCSPGAYFEIREGDSIVGDGRVVACGAGAGTSPLAADDLGRFLPQRS